MLFRLLRASKRNPPETREERAQEERDEPLGIRNVLRAGSHSSGMAQFGAVRERGSGAARERGSGLEMGIKRKELAADVKTELESEM